MRRIYLIRHGMPEKSTSEKVYIGVTDIPLSTRGSAEAAQLGRYFLHHLSATTTVRILTSPLQRCCQTAEKIYRVLSDGGIKLSEPSVVEALHEINLGEWEGKRVQKIREHFPEVYEARGRALGTYPTPGGESFLEAGVRFQKAIEAYLPDLDESESLLIVAHAGVIRVYLSLLTGRELDHLMDIPLPYASVTELLLNSEGTCVVPDGIGVRPEELLDAAEITRLYQKYETPPRVIRHMRKVAELAMQLMDGIQMRGRKIRSIDATGEDTVSAPSDSCVLAVEMEKAAVMPGLNRVRVIKACLLHDLCRAEKQHARVSAEAIRKEGYPAIAALVAGHHEAAYSEREAQGPLTEAEILFYADKRVQEDVLVSVEERFRESRKKCRSPEACAKHDAMLAKTLKIEKKILKNRR
ncbi:MAG: histidine phosphatase family protein [Lachnospiraceae bacterium]|nr:histidine phosphatase family protein [Lachnospiraceae bacterium]